MFADESAAVQSIAGAKGVKGRHRFANDGTSQPERRKKHSRRSWKTRTVLLIGLKSNAVFFYDVVFNSNHNE
ncbi:hypothetical protein [Pseudomonas moorei]|uniref:hypothetical protein n=1 Tax=Pseudomonas moorei TaxID=395599 RepID=UPI001FF41BEA|nr:hypothetical protein [Pseudomonas moorei]